MAIDAAVEDGSKPTNGLDAEKQLLAAFSGLQSGNHTVTLTTRPVGTGELLYFAQSVVYMEVDPAAYVAVSPLSGRSDRSWIPALCPPPHISTSMTHHRSPTEIGGMIQNRIIQEQLSLPE